MSPAPPTHPGPSEAASPSLAQTAERLTTEFAAAVDRPTVTRVIRRCHRDLRGSPSGALPELVERLAREDLADLTGGTIHPTRPRPARAAISPPRRDWP